MTLGLEVALEEGITHVEVESNVELAIKILNKEDQIYFELGILFSEIFGHVFREKNLSAN